LIWVYLAHAYIEKSVFTDWHFKPPIIPNSQKERAKDMDDSDDSNEEESGKRKNDDEEEDGELDVKFEVSMSSLIECLNIFGTASSHKTYTKNFGDSLAAIDDGSSVTGLPAKRRFDDDSLVFQKGKHGPSKARKLPISAVRISYDGEGHPLVLLSVDPLFFLSLLFRPSQHSFDRWYLLHYSRKKIASKTVAW
jgi:cell cycle checkpoint protein